MKDWLLIIISIACIIGGLSHFLHLSANLSANNLPPPATPARQSQDVAALPQGQAGDGSRNGWPYVGNPAGDVKITLFTDYKCPTCRSLEPLLMQLLRQDGNVEVIYHDYPALGPLSLVGARYAEAVYLADPGKYLAFHEALMRSGYSSEESVQNIAGSLGLDAQKLQSAAYSAPVVAMLRANLAYRFPGVPAMFINGRQVRIAANFTTLQMQVAGIRRSVH